MDIIAAFTFVWLGMVLAISFLEAPLKFRAPDVTLRLGLGIGRVVFRALNTVEVVLAAVIGVVLLADDDVARNVLIASAASIAVLVVQLVAVRPPLTRRSDRVLAGEESGSRTHLVYIALEVLKVAGLITTGVLALG